MRSVKSAFALLLTKVTKRIPTLTLRDVSASRYTASQYVVVELRATPLLNKTHRVARFTRKKITASCGKNGGESIDRTVSVTLGKGCLTHNDRSFIAENVDGNRSHLNVTYCNVPLKETYHKLFDEALEKYNAKQKRADRRIPDYYEKIRLSKQEKLFHEVIVQVGNFADMSAVGENGELAKRILDEYMQGFIKRNHTLHVFSAHLHMDEATPHLHIDFVPIVTKWIIDPDAAEVVRRIFRLCIEGNGNETIARILQDDKVLVPQAYWQSKGMSRGGKKTQPNPYKWCKTTIAKMLGQQEYCGDIINFKSYSKSFRNKTRVENPKENWAIFKDVHEPIIDRETWERVQELTKNSKRRKPKNENVKKSIFTNLLYCGDCGHKLWFNINKQNPSIRFYSCSNYKGLRGTCESTHYVREDSLEQVVKMELFKLATYLDHDENAFAELLEHKSNKDSMVERKAAESALAAATARSQELLRLYERVYEDNVNGKVTDDWFMRLSHKYEVEQEELKKQMFDLRNKIERLDTAQNSSGSFIRAIRKFMTMQVLTPVVLQELIDKIEVFPIEGTGKNRTQRLVIHYRFVGCIDLPSIVPKHTYKLDSRQGVAIEYLPSAV